MVRGFSRFRGGIFPVLHTGKIPPPHTGKIPLPGTRLMLHLHRSNQNPNLTTFSP